MKRYALFAGMQYEPRGGWGDYIDSFDTKEEAVGHYASVLSDQGWCDWFQVVDLTTGTIMGES
jgi:hypothetical protein